MAIVVRPNLAAGEVLEEVLARESSAWEELPPGPEVQRRYDEHLFPLTCERFRRFGAATLRAEVAFIPVGTQPYSPILAALANPANFTLLLHTEGSRSHCERVREALADEPLHLTSRPIGDGTDGHRIARVVHGEITAAGPPPAQRVVVDVTSGRKATVAVLGAIAAVRGFRQAYIEGNPSRHHPNLYMNERYVAVANVRDYFQEEERTAALALLGAGSFAAASQILLQIGTASGAGAGDLCLGHAAAAWAAWWSLDWRRAARSFRSARGLVATATVHALLTGLARAATALAQAPAGAPLLRHATATLALAALHLHDSVRAAALLQAAVLPPAAGRGEIGRTLRHLRHQLISKDSTADQLKLLHDPLAASAELADWLGVGSVR